MGDKAHIVHGRLIQTYVIVVLDDGQDVLKHLHGLYGLLKVLSLGLQVHKMEGDGHRLILRELHMEPFL